MLRFVILCLTGAGVGLLITLLVIIVLFYPKKAVYIGKLRLPLTPGIIPKRKNEIAELIGSAVGSRVISSKSLTDALLSDEMVEIVHRKIEKFFEDNRGNESTIYEILRDSKLNDDHLSDMKEELVKIISSRIVEMDLGTGLSGSVSKKLKDGANLLGGGLFAQRLISDEFIDNMSNSIGERINRIIASGSKDIVRKLIDNEAENIGKTKICDIIEKYNDELPKITDGIVQLYKGAVEIGVEKIFDQSDFSELVEAVICEYDVAELEKLILNATKKYIKAIAFSGALMGFVIGFINSLIVITG